MSGRNTRKDLAKPATRSNYVPTPVSIKPRDITLPQGLPDADPLNSQHPRREEGTRQSDVHLRSEDP